MAVGRVGVRSDQHGAAGVLAVVEGEEQASSLVPVFVVIATKRENAAAQLCDAHEYPKQVTEMAESFEVTIGECAHIRCETYAEKIEGIDMTPGVRQTDEIDGTLAVREDGLQGRFGAIVCEVAKEGIAGAEWQETQRNAFWHGA